MNASGRPGIREFKNDPGLSQMSRHEVRTLYRSLYGRGNDAIERDRLRPGITGIAPINATILPEAVKNADDKSTRIRHLSRGELHSFKSTAQENGKQVRLASGVTLDLSSNERNIVLGSSLFQVNDSVEITEGGQPRKLSTGTLVTASEYLAVKQKLGGGEQSLVVDSNGIAVGGSVDFNSLTGNDGKTRTSNLVIANGVTARGALTRHSDFVLSGDLSNYGSLVLTGEGNSRALVKADDITVFKGADISTVSARGSHGTDLELQSTGDFSNYGLVQSSGNLTISANGIKNEGVLSASKTIDVLSPHVSNSGSIESINGDTRFDAPKNSDLTIANAGGSISALNGTIALRPSNYDAEFNNTILGGNLASKVLELNAGSGSNFVNVNQLTGTVVQSGGAGHVWAATDTLTIGKTCYKGDPTFFNTAGNINIAGDIEVAEALTVIASGNITSTDNLTIRATDSTTQGYDMTFIAGANITNSGGTSVGTIPPLTNNGQVTINGGTPASSTGGSVLLGNNVAVFSTGGFSDGPGGDVNMYAFQGGTAGSGQVDVHGTFVATRGLGNGPSGDFTVIAGSHISIGEVDTLDDRNVPASQLGGSGSVTFITSQPVSSGGGNIVYESNGSRSSTDFLTAGPALSLSNITIDGASGTFFRVGKDLTMSAGANILAANGANIETTSFDANVSLQAGADIGSPSVPLTISGFNTTFDKKLLGALYPNLTSKQLKTFVPGAGKYEIHSGGFVNIQRNATTAIEILQSDAPFDFTFLTNSPLSISGDITTNNGPLHIQANGRFLNVADNVTIFGRGQIKLENLADKKLKPTITIGSGATLDTTPLGGLSGQVIINLGSIPAFKAVVPKNEAFLATSVTGVDGALTFFGKLPEFKGPTVNTITVDNTPVEINNGAKKGAIIFAGGTTISAAP